MLDLRTMQKEMAVRGQRARKAVETEPFSDETRHLLRVANCSSPGTGKTIANILAMLEFGSELTIVVCSARVIEMVGKDGKQNGFMPAVKTNVKGAICERTWSTSFIKDANRQPGRHWLFLSVDEFSDRDGGKARQGKKLSKVRTKIKALLESLEAREIKANLVLDEVHLFKQRDVRERSSRRHNILYLRQGLEKINPNLFVIVNTATPILNGVREPLSILELLDGKRRDKQPIWQSSKGNSPPGYLQVHADLKRYMVRHHKNWDSDFKTHYNEKRGEDSPISVKLTDAQVREVVRQKQLLDKTPKNGTSDEDAAEHHSNYDRALIPYKTPELIRLIKRKKKEGRPVLVYSIYTEEVMEPIRKDLRAAGLKVECYFGNSSHMSKEETKPFEMFCDGKLDALVISDVVREGVDGLQEACSDLVFMCLPHTHASYEQVCGRIRRGGQIRKEVNIDIILAEHPKLTHDRKRFDRLFAKGQASSAVLDGKVMTPTVEAVEAFNKGVDRWEDRVDREGEVEHDLEDVDEIEDEDACDVEDCEPKVKRTRSSEGFERTPESREPGTLRRTNADNLHETFAKDPKKWHDYHARREKSVKRWKLDPRDHFVREVIGDRTDLSIGDFGCGTAKIGEALGETNEVWSIDHVAIHDGVVAANMKETPIEDKSLDIAVFCLSLWGSEEHDLPAYLDEAFRCLKQGGELHIYETFNHFAKNQENIEAFKAQLSRLGFLEQAHEELGNIIHISARRMRRQTGRDTLKKLHMTKHNEDLSGA